MPAVYSDGFLDKDYNIEESKSLDRKAFPTGLNPDRLPIYTIPVHDYLKFSLSLGPTEEDKSLLLGDIFDPLNFYIEKLDFNDPSADIYRSLFVREVSSNLSVQSISNIETDFDVSNWFEKYRGFIPSNWDKGVENIELAVDQIEKIFYESNGTLHIHPYLINALIEYPYKNKPISPGLRIARLFELNYPQLAVLTKMNEGNEFLYTKVYPRQYRRNNVQIAKYGTREVEQIYRSKDDQMVNRLIFEMLPLKHRKLFRRKIF